MDILFNNAGIISYRQGIGAVTAEEWDTVIDVNLRGPFLLCQGLMEGMKRRGGGRIINASSLAARVGGIEAGIHYAASKAGLLGLTRTQAKEGGPYGITANAIAPGIIATDPVRKQISGHEESYTSGIPLRRLGTPEDVANVVLFLASALSAYVTGIVVTSTAACTWVKPVTTAHASTRTVPYEQLCSFVQRVLTAVGVPTDDAAVADCPPWRTCRASTATAVRLAHYVRCPE